MAGLPVTLLNHDRLRGAARFRRLKGVLRVLGLAGLLSFGNPALSERCLAQSVADTTYQLRKFDPAHLAPYLADPDYAYQRRLNVGAPGLWERFMTWLYDHLFRHIFREGTEDYWRWAVYSCCALVIGWAILRLTGTSISGLLTGRGGQMPLRYDETEANIHFIDFEKMIQEAIDTGQLRRAVRLFYLKTLKQLSDRELIEWRPDKTNNDYLREWKRADIEPEFRRLTFLFEYICYGDFAIDRAGFERTQRAFLDFENQLRKAA